MLGSMHVVTFVPTRDAAAARAFYEGTLGLRFVKDDGFAHVFDANGIMLRVVPVREFTPPPHTILGWNVTDIARVVAGLRDRGVAFERFDFLKPDELGIWTAPNGDRVAWFRDPDGNLLSISEHV